MSCCRTRAVDFRGYALRMMLNREAMSGMRCGQVECPERAPTAFGYEYARVVGEVGEAPKTVVAGQWTSGKGHIMCGVRGNRLAHRDQACTATQSVAGNVRLPAVNAHSVPDNDLHEHTGDQA